MKYLIKIYRIPGATIALLLHSLYLIAFTPTKEKAEYQVTKASKYINQVSTLVWFFVLVLFRNKIVSFLNLYI